MSTAAALPAIVPLEAVPSELQALADALERGAGRDEVLRVAVREMCRVTSVERCVLYVRREDDLYHGHIGHGLDQAHVERLVCGLEADQLTREIVACQNAIAVAETACDPRVVVPAMRTWNIRSMLGVPVVDGDDVPMIFFVDSGAQRREFDEATCARAVRLAEAARIVAAQSDRAAEANEAARTAQAQAAMLSRGIGLEDRLAALVLRDAGLDELVAEIARCVARPCAVHDASLRRLALAVPDGADAAALVDLAQPAVRHAPALQRALAMGDRARVTVLEPQRSRGVHHRVLLATILGPGGVAGVLSLGECRTRLSQGDGLLAQRAATLLSMQLHLMSRTRAAEVCARGAVAEELVRGTADLRALRQRAAQDGIELDRMRTVVLLAGADPKSGPLDDAAVAARLDHVPAGTALVPGLDAGTVALLVEGTSADARAAVETLHDDAGHRLVAVIAEPAFEPEDVAGRAAEAAETLRCVIRIACTAGPLTIVHAADVGAAGLFLAHANPDDIDRFVDRVLGPISGEEQLMDTVAALCDHGWSVRTCATLLDVHENTIRNRLGRVERLTRQPVRTNARAQMEVKLALVLRQLRAGRSEPAWPVPAPEVESAPCVR